ncbi:MAG: amidohydrolase family protein [Candidatus Tectomicrobia bacterium]|nr:amidohydrolase family protein [Candidatus Tectomicrobia bacterium]
MRRIIEEVVRPDLDIVAATKHSVLMCNRDKDLETLKPGKLADLFVVAGNPLEDLDSLKNVTLVVKDGKIVEERKQRRRRK